MRLVEEDQLLLIKERPERAEGSIVAGDLAVSDETLKKKVREQEEEEEVSDPEQIAQSEYRTLVAQLLILGVIAGSVGWLIAAYPY
jgi:hypothetical protein